MEEVLYAARRGRELGKTVILNPAPAPDRLPDELLGLVDYLTPNETELAKLSGIAAMGQADLKLSLIHIYAGRKNQEKHDEGHLLCIKRGCYEMVTDCGGKLSLCHVFF